MFDAGTAAARALRSAETEPTVEPALPEDLGSHRFLGASNGTTVEASEPVTVAGQAAPSEPIPLVLPKASPQAQDHFQVLASYEGEVLSVDETSFWARITDRAGQVEEAQFPLAEVSRFDRELVQSGGIFYWYLGYHDSPSGQRRRQSVIRFRRLPSWTKAALQKAQAEAERLLERLQG